MGAGPDAGWRSVRCRPWWSRQRVTGVGLAAGAGLPGAGLRTGGAVPWCSRWYSSSLWGPSGMRVRARLVRWRWCCGGRRVSGRGSVRTGGVGRRRGGGAGSPGGVGPGGDAVGGEGDLPAGALFDAVVSSAQAEQVVRRWWVRWARVGRGRGRRRRRRRCSRGSGSVGPWPGSVGPSAPRAGTGRRRPRPPGPAPGRRRHRQRDGVAAPALARASVARPRRPSRRWRRPRRWREPLVRSRDVVVEQGAGDRVAGRDLHGGAAGGVGGLGLGGEPPAGHQHRLAAAEAGDLDQVTVTDHGARPATGPARATGTVRPWRTGTGPAGVPASRVPAGSAAGPVRAVLRRGRSGSARW